MTEATPKQIAYAKQLGIEGAENYTKQALSKMIDEQVSNKPAQSGSNQATAPITAKHDVTLTKIDKPHSYEFGKAGNRHKVYYNEPMELAAHIKTLETLGYLEGPIETVKIDDDDEVQ